MLTLTAEQITADTVGRDGSRVVVTGLSAGWLHRYGAKVVGVSHDIAGYTLGHPRGAPAPTSWSAPSPLGDGTEIWTSTPVSAR